jgi:uncharacterized membrane protein YbhN (UPF0104 family)
VSGGGDNGRRERSERAELGGILAFDRRRALLTGLAALVLGGGALALLSQASDLGRAVDAVEQADAWWLPALLLGEILAYTGYAFGYRVIARACGGYCVRFGTALQLTAVSFGAYIVASSAGGLAVDMWALHRAGEDLHRAGRRILAFNILEWAILGSTAAVSGALALAGFEPAVPAWMALGWLTAVPAAAAGALWFSAPRRRRRFAQIPTGEEPDDSGRLTRERLVWLRVKVRKGFADAIGALVFLRSLLARPVRYGGAPGGFSLYWAGHLLTLYAALRALGADIGLLALVLAYATGYVVTSAPLPAGAAGFSEAVTAVALHAVGIDLGIAILAALLFRLATFWLPIPIALAVVPRVRVLNDRLPDVPREPDPPCRIDL